MNVTFHAIGSFATAAVLSVGKNDGWRSFLAFKKYIVGFILGILIHGILDFSPHEYPIPSKIDVVLALILLSIFLFISQRQNFLLILVCFAGSIFPDVIDLGPEIANKYLGIEFPHFPFHIFPWHWKEYSGSIYDGNHRIESIIYHLSLLFVCSILLYTNRNNFFRFLQR